MSDLALLPRLGYNVILGWGVSWCLIVNGRGPLFFLFEVLDQTLTGFLVADRPCDKAMVGTSVESFDTPVFAFTLEIHVSDYILCEEKCIYHLCTV